MMSLHCKPIVELPASRNWKKQLQHNWVLAIPSKNQFKIKKVNLFRESSGLPSYYVFDLTRLYTAFEISYVHELEQLSKEQPQFLIVSYVRN